MALTEKDRNWIENHFDRLRELIVNNQVDIAILKVKAGIWGLLGGLIPVLIAIGAYFIHFRGK